MLELLTKLAVLLFVSLALGGTNDPNNIDIEVMKQFTDLVYMGNITIDFKQPLCTQQGITCGGGRITGINFTGSGLRGQIPRSFQYLSDLTVLDLSYNRMTGTLPRRFDEFDKMQAMFLNNNQFFGTIPTTWKNLDKLVALDLSNNFLAGKFIPGLNLQQFSTLRMLGTNLLCPYPDYSSVPNNDFVFQQSCNICNQNSCLSQGDCKVQSNYEFSCNCYPGIDGDYCEGHNLQPNNQYEQDWGYSSASFLSFGLFSSLFLPLLSLLAPLL